MFFVFKLLIILNCGAKLLLFFYTTKFFRKKNAFYPIFFYFPTKTWVQMQYLHLYPIINQPRNLIAASTHLCASSSNA
jgi:hypothetical protein